MNNKTLFSAVVEFEDGFEDTFDIELDKDEESLTYDEVVDAICGIVEKEYHFSFTKDELEDSDFKFPYKIVDIVINVDGQSYPVVPEDFDDTELKNSQSVSKYLVLPYARYSLTPEYKLYMNLIKQGIIDENSPFNFEKYHDIVNKGI